MTNKNKKNCKAAISVYDIDILTSQWILTEDSIQRKRETVEFNGDMHIILESHVINCILLTLLQSINYRRRILSRCFDLIPKQNININVYIIPDKKQILDVEWNDRIERLVQERLVLDTVMSYLSTLGGAFSALGDHRDQCARTAGVISWQQFQIALRLGEEPLAVRCQLYLALSLMQQGYHKVAKKTIEHQYKIALVIKDDRLINMCKGTWAKLQYCYKISKRNKVVSLQRLKIEE